MIWFAIILGTTFLIKGNRTDLLLASIRLKAPLLARRDILLWWLFISCPLQHKHCAICSVFEFKYTLAVV
jgi:hypothetical protein